jgi:hypothetical protein
MSKRISAVFKKLSDLQAGIAVGRNVSNARHRLTLSVDEPVEPEDILVAEQRPDYLSAINGRVIVAIKQQIEVNLTSLNSGKIGLIEDVYSLETRMVSQQR